MVFGGRTGRKQRHFHKIPEPRELLATIRYIGRNETGWQIGRFVLRLTDNNNKADAVPSETLDKILTGLRVSAIALIFMCCSANAEILIEIGPNFSDVHSTESVSLLIQKRWQDKYVVGLGYMSPQTIDTCGRPDCKWEIHEQYMIGVERLFAWRKLSLGIGLYYIDEVHRISSANLNART